MKKIFVFIVSALLLAACLPQNLQLPQMPQSPLLPLLERKSGLIAYVGIDGNVFVADQSGQNPTQLTKDALLPKNQGDPLLLYEYPTWSHDGRQLAFLGINFDGQQIQSRVLVANMSSSSVNEVYKSNSERPDFLDWSPDNASLGLLATDPSGQNTILESIPAKGGQPTIFDAGSPYYWSWAPDGRTMIVHAGGGTSSTPEHTSFLSIDTNNVTEQVLNSDHASFQAPAWSPDGSHIALARTSGQENQIVVTDAAGQNPKKIGTFTGKAAFAWSSDGTRLAYIDAQQPMDPGIVGTLHVADLKTAKDIKEDGNLIAFFWAPNGQELAYFDLVQAANSSSSGGSSSGGSSQSSPQLALDLHVLDVNSGQEHKVTTFIPSQLFMSILPYFDQYQQAVTIWSPDSNNLVLSMVDQTSGEPGIAIVAASGNLQPRIMTPGFLAFWSWQ